MIIGIGSDIVEIARIAALQARHPAFARRILCESEYAQWRRRRRSSAFLAKRWAAKEAVLKALGTGLRQEIRLQDICVINDELGRPEVCLSAEAARAAQRRGIGSVHLSLSDEREYALAFAVAEGA